MVDTKKLFLIDGCFILKHAMDTFLGCRTFVRDGTNHTIAFGFLRDLLRLRMDLGIESGLIVFGKETHSKDLVPEAQTVGELLQMLRLPTIRETNHCELDIVQALVRERACVVTNNLMFLQLARDGVQFVIVKGMRDFQFIPSDMVKSIIGVEPRFVSNYLTLTSCGRRGILSKNQAIRLIERHGELPSIYKNISQIRARSIRDKLISERRPVENSFEGICIGEGTYSVSPELLRTSVDFGRIDCERNIAILQDLKFFSLCRLLGTPSGSRRILDRHKEERLRYQAIVTLEGLQWLQEKVSHSEYCAIDCESSGKDPHSAELFGVSFCFTAEEAYYVPVTDVDLEQVKKDQVLAILSEIFAQPVQFIGHNIKYDRILLYRNGIEIRHVHFDTMLAAHDCFGDWTYLNLGALSEKLIGRKTESYTDVVGQHSTFLDLPFKMVVRHGCQDAEVALLLYWHLKKDLCKKGIYKQYMTETMGLHEDLYQLECKGVRVKVKQLKSLRNRILRSVSSLRAQAHENAGRQFDLDSNQELEEILSLSGSTRRIPSAGRTASMALEKLACVNPLVQIVVRYKRLKQQMNTVDTITRSVSDGAVRPVFNMVKSKYGAIAASSPDVFGRIEIDGLRDCFSSDFTRFFADSSRALDLLQNITRDSFLRSDRANYEKRNLFVVAASGIEHPKSDRFLLLLIIGDSDSRLFSEFLIDELRFPPIRTTIEQRYSTAFEWIESFRKEAQAKGFAEWDGRRRYFDGLHSSDLSKRKSALRYCVRWLIQY